jgi:mono/diheme cytochrome c family protein
MTDMIQATPEAMIQRATITSATTRPPPRRVPAALSRSLAIGLIALAAGCPATEDPTPDGGVTPDGGGGQVQATFTSLYGDYFSNCMQCHTPSAPGRTSETEDTLNFTSRSTAFMTIKTGMATGLVGNQADCNGVPFVASTPGASLVLAVIDQPTRQAIDLPAPNSSCDVDAISDMTAKVGSQPSAAFIAALKTWITNGAMDN